MSKRIDKSWVVFASVENDDHGKCVDIFIALTALLDLKNFGEMLKTPVNGHRSRIIRERPMPHQWPPTTLPNPLLLGSRKYCASIRP